MGRSRKPRILVIVRGHLGDVVTALPALRDLRAGRPGARITVVVNEYVRGAFEGCPYVDEVIYGFGYGSRSGWSKAAARLGLVARIAARYDVALTLRSGPRWGPILGRLSGARVRVGYHQKGWAGLMLTHDLGAEPRVQSNRITNGTPVRALGLQTDPAMPRLDWVSDAERRHSARLLAEHGVTGSRRYAIFQLAAHWGCYEWSSEKWALVADHLAQRHNLGVIVVGTGEDFEIRKFDEVSRLSPVPVSIQGKTTLPMLFDIVSGASIVVAADSALTQISIAQRVPSVILFGIEPQVRNGPLPEEAGTLMESAQYWEGPELAPRPNPHCRFGESHCHTANCTENSSFRRIGADEVCRRVDRILEHAETPKALV